MIRVSDLVEWILKNRKGTAFRGYSEEKIICEVVEGLENETMSYSLDASGQITGVVCGTKDASKKVFYCHDILVTKKGIVKDMMRVFMSLYPDYTIEGINKNGRFRQFKNPEKLTKRL